MTDSPAPGRRERKKEETRRRIVEVASRLFERDGMDATTMERIADAADVAKATLYSYFPVKEAIILAQIQDAGRDSEPLFRQLLATVPDTRTRLHALFHASATWFEKHPDILRAYLRYRLPNILAHSDPSQRSGFEARLVEVLAAGQAAGEVRTDLTPHKLARMLEGMSLQIWLGWLTAPDDWPQDASFARMVDLFLDGAGAPNS